MADQSELDALTALYSAGRADATGLSSQAVNELAIGLAYIAATLALRLGDAAKGAGVWVVAFAPMPVILLVTGKCQLQCMHCYADSGPSGSHGAMETADWIRVIEEAAGLGVGMVQFIGGEPTLHPALPALRG